MKNSRMRSAETVTPKVTVLQVTSVKVRRRSISEGADISTIHVLEKLGCYSVGSVGGFVSAKAPREGNAIILELDVTPGERQATFRVIWIKRDGCREQIDFGTTFDIDTHIAGKTGVYGNGTAYNLWEVECVPYDAVKVGEALKSVSQGTERKVYAPVVPKPLPTPPPKYEPAPPPPPKPVVVATLTPPPPAPQRIPVKEPVRPPVKPIDPALIAPRATVPPKPVQPVVTVPKVTIPLKPTEPLVVQKAVDLPGGAQIIGMALRVPVKRIIVFQPQVNDPRFSGQPRKYFNEESLRELAEGIKKHGQQEKGTVRRYMGPVPNIDWELTNGERRFRAIQLAGLEFMDVNVEEPGNKKAQHLSALIKNVASEPFTPLELSNALQEQIEAGETHASLAVALIKSLSTINKLLSLQKLHPDLKPLIDPPTPEKDRIRLSEGARLSKIAPEEQVRIWNDAKRQKTRGLISKRIEELGRPFMPHLKEDRWNTASRHTRRIERRFDALQAVVMDLRAFSSGEFNALLKLRGVTSVETCNQLKVLAEATSTMDKVRKTIIEELGNLSKSAAA